MQPSKRAVQFIPVLALIFLCTVEQSFAGEISDTDRIESGLLLASGVGAVATIVIEYGLIWDALRRRVRSKFSLLVWVTLMSLLSNPGASLAAWYFLQPEKYPEAFISLGITLLVALAFEFLLLGWVFDRMCRHGTLTERITTRRRFAIALKANGGSIIFRLLTFVGVLASMRDWMKF